MFSWTYSEKVVSHSMIKMKLGPLTSNDYALDTYMGSVKWSLVSTNFAEFDTAL